MKTSSVAVIALAAFAGALTVLEVQRATARPSFHGGLAVPEELMGEPVAYQQTSTGPADFRAASRKVLPSVVSVDKYQWSESFFEEPGVRETASGSGVVLSHDGTIVTNNHVVEGATEVRVRLADKRTFTAEVVGTDKASDLAVLRVKANDLTPIEMGNSDKLEVGQWVLAAGSPLGFEQTVSVGVVSNKSRSLGTPGSVLVNAIQTDAAINPGNSGGALTDADGRLVGINSVISSNTGTNIGIGFAIPVNRVRRIAREIIETGHAKNPYLGVSLSPRYDGLLETEEGRRQLSDAVGAGDVPHDGVLIPPGGRFDSISSGSPAAKAGLRPLDVLLAIDGKPLTDRIDYFSDMESKRPGDTVSVKYWSRGSVHTATITLIEEPLDS